VEAKFLNFNCVVLGLKYFSPEIGVPEKFNKLSPLIYWKNKSEDT